MKYFTMLFVAISLSFDLYSSPVPAEKLFQSPNMSIIKISPENKKVSFQTSDSKQRQFSLFDIETGEISHLIALNDKQFINYSTWLNENTIVLNLNNNGRNTLYVAKISKDESINKYVSKTKKVHAPGFILSAAPEFEGKILFASRENRDTDYSLYIAEISSVIEDKLNRELTLPAIPSSISNLAYDHQKRSLIGLSYDTESKKTTLKQRPLATKKWKNLATRESRKSVFMPVNFIDDETIAVLTNEENDKVALVEFDIASQKLGKVLYEHPVYDLTDAEVSYLTGQVNSVSFIDHGQLNTLHFIEEEKQLAEQLKESFPGKQVVSVTESFDRNLTVLLVFSSSDPGSYYLFDKNTKKLKKLGDIFTDLSNYNFSPTKTVKVNISKGVEIESYLTLPLENNIKALLVMPHGGPINVRDYSSFDAPTQYFASRGFSVLKVNFRGSKGFGKNFTESGRGQFGKSIEEDIKTVLAEVMSKHDFDKICSVGTSYGGYSSYMLSITQPEVFDCVIASFGVYDLPLLFNTSNLKVSDDYRDFVARTVGKMDKSMADFSPVYLADKIETPSLIIAGDSDDIAGYEQSQRMHYVLEKLGKDVEYLTYKNVGHGHRSWWGDWHQYAITYDFLQRKLNLPSLDNKAIDADVDMLTEEIVRLADAYYFGNRIEIDRDKAFRFYEVAAQRGNAHSMYYLGAHFETGEGVEKDFDTALDWYEKSSKSGYAEASYRLGELYYEGSHVKTNYKKSFEYIELASRQGADAKALILLARANCLGFGTDKNMEKCLELLDLSTIKQKNQHKVSAKSRQVRNEALVDIILSKKLSESELSNLHDKIAAEYQIEIFSMDIDEVDSGEFIRKSYREAEYRMDKDIVAKEGSIFGSSVSIASDNIFSNLDRRTAILGLWTRVLKDGQKETVHKLLLYGARRENWRPRHRLTKRQLETAKWTLQLFDLHGNQLYKKDFNVVSQSGT